MTPKYRTVGEWYRENRGRVPIQMAQGIERVMKEEGLTFEEAYARLVESGNIIELDQQARRNEPESE